MSEAQSATPKPAILGGEPACPAGPPDWPSADEDVHGALQAAYHDGSWGKYHGGNVERLEQELRTAFGVEHALTCSSGTVAVELALRGLKIGPGDEVILAAYDYPGNFLSVHAVGAMPVLVDIDPENWNLAPRLLADAFGPKTRAAIVSHLHGGLVSMADVMNLAHARGLPVIEDAAQSPGAVIHGKMAGAWGDVGILSFGGSKLVTAGRGGAMLTARAEVHQRAKTWMQRGNRTCPLSELQAAVLLPQLGKLAERNGKRAANVALLVESLRDVTGLKPFRNGIAESSPAYYKLGFQYDAAVFGLPRERFVAAARAEGIALDEGFAAAHVGRSPRRFRQAGSLEEAERAHNGCVILHHPVLLEDKQRVLEVAQGLKKVWDHRGQLGASNH